MEIRRARWVLLAVALASGCAGTNGGAPRETADEPREDVVVQFTGASLSPPVARVRRGGDVAWLNNALGYTGVVFFPASIEDSFTCDELRPLLTKVPAGYRSELITSSVEKGRLPCPLKPGTYVYELRLFDVNFEGIDDPVRTLSGKIVVE